MRPPLSLRLSWFNITNPVGMMKAGRVRALAIAAERRLAQHPDVPTLSEVGFPGIRASQWVARNSKVWRKGNAWGNAQSPWGSPYVRFARRPVVP